MPPQTIIPHLNSSAENPATKGGRAWSGVAPPLRNRVMIFSTFAASVRFRYDVPGVWFRVSGFGFSCSEESRNDHLGIRRLLPIQVRRPWCKVSGFAIRKSGFEFLRKRQMVLLTVAASARFRHHLPASYYGVAALRFGVWKFEFHFRIWSLVEGFGLRANFEFSVSGF